MYRVIIPGASDTPSELNDDKILRIFENPGNLAGTRDGGAGFEQPPHPWIKIDLVVDNHFQLLFDLSRCALSRYHPGSVISGGKIKRGYK